MHKSLILTNLGGVYAYQNTLAFMQDGYGGALDAIAAGFGDKIVISGCEDTGTAVADGWVSIGGVIMRFTGAAMPGTPMVKVTTLTTNELYDDGVNKPFYVSKVASLVSIGDFDYSELKRLQGNKGLFDSILEMQRIISSIVNKDDAVILSGCIVSSVDTGLGTLSISAGTALMGGVFRDVPAYTGTYSVYLTSAGTWSNSLPSAPFVLFNPYTSQYYVDVMRRALTPTGEIKMYETLSDRFDTATGVGKWEMKGFSLMARMQSRVPIGLWWDGDAVDNVTDANHADADNQGGEKEHQLTEAELPQHTHGLQIEKQYRGDVGNPIHSLASQATGLGTFDGETDGGSGGEEAHNNLQPYTVVVYAKRTA